MDIPLMANTKPLPPIYYWAERVFWMLMLLILLNTGWLTWRFTALEMGLATPGTGFCSLSARVDCDAVLQSDEAQYFGLPNAYFGFGFFVWVTVWFALFPNLGLVYRRWAYNVLALGFLAAIPFTLFFLGLLVNMPVLCPVCPINHFLTWFAFDRLLRLRRFTPIPDVPPPLKPFLKRLGLSFVPTFVLWYGWWMLRG
ncbi:MAG TPA: vitamin K epoxide reductase family protein [Rhodothermales bacterium]|nr:hypothetical protein [Bacteroidota bacterium]HRK72788.1 vitamin K epoxide reductase family protein [Rhodothermales bacterium]HRR08085.1 vitamin K epoxide reductase family protein [Rhodothermales bacterium]